MQRTTKDISIDMNKQEMALEIFGSDPFLVVNKKLLTRLGPIKAIFINNLIDKYRYFKNRNMLSEDGGFFLTYEEQMEQTGITKNQLRSCKQSFLKDGILTTKMKGIPPKEFYYLNLKRLVDVWLTNDLETAEMCKNSLVLKSDQLGYENKTNVSTKIRPIYKENKYKENKYKEEAENLKMGKSDSIVNKKNNLFLSNIANRLVTILEKKGVYLNSKRLEKWIEKLINENEGLSISRIEKVLDWYENNLTYRFTPSINKEKDFFDKFFKIETTIKLQQKEEQKNNGIHPSGKPRDVSKNSNNSYKIDLVAKLGKTLGPIFQKKVVEPALDMFPSTDENIVVQQLLDLNEAIERTQEASATRTVVSSYTLISDYLDWIDSNKWINNREDIRLLDFNNKVFRNSFIPYYAKKRGEDPFTGQMIVN